MKRISNANLEDSESLKNELKILSNVDNPNIINVIEVFLTNANFDIIMENCEGGSLLDRINTLLDNNKCFTSKQSADILKQIVSGLKYAHENGVVHRDIKLENILLLGKDLNDTRIKIIDFGLAKSFEQSVQRMKEKQGTCIYMSPEILKGNYNEKCDIWACGVLLYIMLIGTPPFFSDTEGNDEEIYKKILNIDYRFSNKCIQLLI